MLISQSQKVFNLEKKKLEDILKCLQKALIFDSTSSEGFEDHYASLIDVGLNCLFDMEKAFIEQNTKKDQPRKADLS